MNSKQPSLRRLVERIHRDETGALSLETILLIGVIALPILIFLVKWGWPAIRDYFKKGASDVGIDIPNS
jgi:Flp pilus assembly pilin Flp